MIERERAGYVATIAGIACVSSVMLNVPGAGGATSRLESPLKYGFAWFAQDGL